MKRERFQTALTTILGLVCLGLLVQTAWSAEVPRMTKEELRPLLGDPSVVILDVRVGRSWTESDRKIQGAVRRIPPPRSPPGLPSILKTRRSSYTVPDPPSTPVPGWHLSSWKKVFKKCTPSRGDGTNGMRPSSPPRKNRVNGKKE